MLITIKNNCVSATINTIGAELKSLKDYSEKEYLWTGDPKYWGRSSPLLFPIVGNLRDNKTIIYGKEYTIPKHGFCRDREFEILEQSSTKLTLSLKDSSETLSMYPFHFQLCLTYELNETNLSILYKVHNLDAKQMYYHIGAHPGFLCPLFEQEQFNHYILQFEQVETCLSPIYNLETLCIEQDNTTCHLNNSNIIQLNYNLFEQDAIIFNKLVSKKVSLINPAHGKGVAVSYPDFETIAFWTPMEKNAPFICIEPWNGAAIYKDETNELKEKRNIQILNANQSKFYTLGIELLL